MKTNNGVKAALVESVDRITNDTKGWSVVLLDCSEVFGPFLTKEEAIRFADSKNFILINR